MAPQSTCSSLVFQERNHLVLTVHVDKGIAIVHSGKCCILKERRLHMEAPIDAAEAPLGKVEGLRIVVYHFEFQVSFLNTLHWSSPAGKCH